jgi:hypothetical protein
MGYLSTDTSARVPHGLAHPVDRVLGNKTLEPGDFSTGLIIAQAVMGQHQCKDAVPLHEKLRIGSPGRREDNPVIGRKGEKPCVREFA